MADPAVRELLAGAGTGEALPVAVSDQLTDEQIVEKAVQVLAAYLSAHRTMINGSALCAALLSRSVTDPVGLTVAKPFRTPIPRA